MKVEDLKKELTAKIKNLIFEVLKDFDMSKYKIDICILDNECYITILKENIYITTIQYKNENYSFFMIYVFDNLYELLKPSYKINASNNIAYTYESFLDKLNSESIQIITTLKNNKNILEEELKNILE